MRNNEKAKRIPTKRVAALLLALLLLTMVAGRQTMAESEPAQGAGLESRLTDIVVAEGENPTSAPATGTGELPEELIVGNPNATRGDFFTDMFGNTGADIDVRTLIHGYDLINWDQSQGEYAVDPSVVSASSTELDEAGNKVYRFTLCDDLFYSDGSKITAWDYAFSWLLRMCPEIQQIGGRAYQADFILGSKAFYSGESKVLAGVRVLSDLELQITLDRAYLPFYYEEGLLLCNPYPISVIAPDCQVRDDGEGVYIDGEAFTAELLQRTILDPETGYKTHPSVTSGAYVLTSYDGTTCHFERNPYYKGTWLADRDAQDLDESNLVILTDEDGEEQVFVKPAIEKLCYTYVSSDDMLQAFEEGKLHLVNKVVYGETIDALIDSETLELGYDAYARVGLTYIAFSFELPTVREAEVRQAIAWCMDREQITKDFCGEYGVRVNGYYGIQQWEYQLVSGALGYPLQKGYETEDGPAAEPDESAKFPNRFARNVAEFAQMAKAWQSLTLENLTAYEVDTAKANALLDRAGWTLNRNGDRYQAGTDDVRCKRIDGELVALDLKLMYLEGNRIADALQANAIDNLKACGIQLTLVPASANELLTEYYRQAERTTDMIYLGSNFTSVYDPAVTFGLESEGDRKLWNSMYTDDETLYRLALDLRQTEPGDIFTYAKKWVAFEERYNQVLPSIPVYSNNYYDFYIPQLQNYHVFSHTTWAQAILESYLANP